MFLLVVSSLLKSVRIVICSSAISVRYLKSGSLFLWIGTWGTNLHRNVFFIDYKTFEIIPINNCYHSRHTCSLAHLVMHFSCLACTGARKETRPHGHWRRARRLLLLRWEAALFLGVATAFPWVSLATLCILVFHTLSPYRYQLEFVLQGAILDPGPQRAGTVPLACASLGYGTNIRICTVVSQKLIVDVASAARSKVGISAHAYCQPQGSVESDEPGRSSLSEINLWCEWNSGNVN